MFDGIDVFVWSIAGVATSGAGTRAPARPLTSAVQVQSQPGQPKLNVLFDIGSMRGTCGGSDACRTVLERATAAEHVFVSHCHTDHVGAVVSHARTCSFASKHPAYHVPRGSAELITAAKQVRRRAGNVNDMAQALETLDHGEAPIHMPLHELDDGG